MTNPSRRKRIHITGAHRSGTTLMCALMTTCFDIDVAPPNEERLRSPVPPGGRIVCTKSPDESDYALGLLPYDPDLHVIQMVRDPRDVIVSKFGPEPASYFTNLQSWRRNKPSARWRRHPRAHIVSYERLVNRPDEVQAELAAAMPFLETVCAFSAYSDRAQDLADSRELYWSEAMHAIRPPGPESIGRWRQHLERVKGQIARHGDISDELIEMGLEPNNSWLALLEFVAADFTPSHLPEHLDLKSRITRSWRNAVGMLTYLRGRRREKKEASES